MAHLLIVDDEQSICWGLSKLARGLGHSADTAASAEEALEQAASHRPDAIFLDVRLPGISGIEAMSELGEITGRAPTIVMTAYGDLETAVGAVRAGAFEYLVKPFDLDLAAKTLERALGRPLEKQSAQTTAPADLSGTEIIGKSPAMQEVFKRIALVSPSEACVHLWGESGAGKERVARAIHEHSRRAEGPFIPINVASLNPSLAESELFGHVKGAFTGADQPRRGLLEQAAGGTIFLDEVADIPISLQIKLLRVLELGEVYPVGSPTPVKTNFRLISATHRDLQELVVRGDFRHDLYYRLVSFQIRLPPLREHTEDIPELARYFLTLLADQNHWARPELSPAALAELQRRSWHGNIRELRNVLEHALILTRGATIAPDHLSPPTPPTSEAEDTESRLTSSARKWAESTLQANPEIEDLYPRLLRLVEQPVFDAALQRSGGQYVAAARKLGVHRTTLKKKLDDLGRDG